MLQEAGGRPQAPVLGRRLRLGLLDAPLANGQMGHLLDYDDTHMGGVVLHASSPVLAALFALAERKPVSGADLMLAYAVGFEAGVRTGRAAPGHHKGGWHLTGTLGSIAAGVAAGKLLGLDRQRLTYAMGIAATQAGGMQQNRGTMCKSFHAGKAAANGVLAALLAERGFDSTQEIIEGKQGFARIYSDVAAPDALTAGLGRRLADRNQWPQALCLRGRPASADRRGDRAAPRATDIDAGRSAKSDCGCIRFVLSITDVVDPSTGLQSKFQHRALRGRRLHRRRGRHRAIFRRPARDPVVAGLRRKVTARRRNAAQGRGPRRDRHGRNARHEIHIAACQRHRRQSDERSPRSRRSSSPMRRR